jgi:D-glycero-alpha-D-manno-heptose-7-phosphate kinase
MIISRTPFRMSFIGGGTDLPAFYEKHQGAVISTAIDKYVYITANRRFDHTLRISYSQTEITEHVEDIRHQRFREVMKETGVTTGIEITSIADIPAGTGMGSSSSFTVGLFNALHGFQGRMQTAQQLAEQACKLEINTLKEPIGKQDQYAAAYGGLRRYLFNPDGTVYVDPVICTTKRRNEFFQHIMLFYVGGTRDSSTVLTKVSVDLQPLRNLVDDFWNILTSEKEDLRALGEILHDGWKHKKRMSANVSTPIIDDYYETARRAGARGGKILGAGQNGFLMLFCETQYQPIVRNELEKLPSSPKEISFGYESEGSKIIYVGS